MLFLIFILPITDQKYLIVRKYQISNPGTNKRKEIKRLIGIFIAPNPISSNGKGIIKISTIPRKNIIETSKMIICTVIPLILGNMYNKKQVGTIIIMIETKKTIGS